MLINTVLYTRQVFLFNIEKWRIGINLLQSKSPPRIPQAQQRPILMTRRQLTDPFGSDDEEENIQIIDDKWSQSISIMKSQSPVRDVSINQIVQMIAFYVLILSYFATY